MCNDLLQYATRWFRNQRATAKRQAAKKELKKKEPDDGSVASSSNPGDDDQAMLGPEDEGWIDSDFAPSDGDENAPSSSKTGMMRFDNNY